MMHAGMTLTEMEAYIRGMKPDDRAELDQLVQPIVDQPWLPQPGPQATAYDHPAEEILYGGAAGGGKSDLLIGLSTTAHMRSLLFRRQATDLDGLWERLVEVTEPAGVIASQNSVKKKMVLRNGRMIEMGHLEAPGSEKSWQGRAHDLIGFDEAAQLDEAKVMFVLQWLRSTTAGQRVRAMFATNPPIPEMRGGEILDVSSGDWLLRWFAPWIDAHYPNPAQPGEIRYVVMAREGDRFVNRWVDGPGWYSTETAERWEGDEPTTEEIGRHSLGKAKSRTFIKSLVEDNAFLSGSGYVERLSSTPEPLRTMLMSGKFGIKLEDHAWQVIPTNWVLAAQKRWEERVAEIDATPGMGWAPMAVLAADIAQGGIDTTVLAPLHEDNMFGQLTTAPGSKTPDGRSVVTLLMGVQRDGAMIVLDGTGGWGGATRESLRDNHKIEARMCISSEGSSAWTKDMRYRFLNIRAEMWWGFREALDPMSGNDIALPPSDILRAQLTAPHYVIQKNVIQIESKDGLRKRLGSSTDEADGVIMAWKYKPIAIAERHRVDPVSVAHGGWNYDDEQRKRMRNRDFVEDIDPLQGWDL